MCSSFTGVGAHPALDEVLVLDEALPPELLLRLQGLVRRPIWGYGWKSCVKRDRFSFWHAHFAGGDENSTADCEEEMASRKYLAPVLDLWKLLAAGVLKGHIPVRAYANAHTYGVDGYVHTDSKEDNYYSTILFAHDEWEHNWAGETVFISAGEGDVIKAVHPKPGRMVIFKGQTLHVARSPSRECPALRVSVVIKTRVPHLEPLLPSASTAHDSAK